MLDLNCRIEPDPEVVITELEEDKEAVLLHLETKAYFTLNETGLCIWKMLNRDLTLGEISNKLEEVFDVSPEKSGESVLNLIHELVNGKLVKVVDE
ncbi:MAG: PqqD family protein [Planctomycetes bacterium]|nr:PqqD family protein [Planctomycetota bacterium]